ncbi:MAG TPA: hypothetical protein PLN64_00985 [Candidatus Bipolaricaulis anaerobius]|nr:hypothetical protein [Candidatus Bipolaricaulis anaerobius]
MSEDEDTAPAGSSTSVVGWRKFATAIGQSLLLVVAYLFGRWAHLVPESGWESVVNAVQILGVALIAGNTIKGFADIFKK